MEFKSRLQKQENDATAYSPTFSQNKLSVLLSRINSPNDAGDVNQSFKSPEKMNEQGHDKYLQSNAITVTADQKYWMNQDRFKQIDPANGTFKNVSVNLQKDILISIDREYPDMNNSGKQKAALNLQIGEIRKRACNLQRSIQVGSRYKNRWPLPSGRNNTLLSNSLHLAKTKQALKSPTRGDAGDIISKFNELTLRDEDGQIIYMQSPAESGSISKDATDGKCRLDQLKLIDNLRQSKLAENRDENNNIIKQMRLEPKIKYRQDYAQNLQKRITVLTNQRKRMFSEHEEFNLGKKKLWRTLIDQKLNTMQRNGESEQQIESEPISENRLQPTLMNKMQEIDSPDFQIIVKKKVLNKPDQYFQPSAQEDQIGIQKSRGHSQISQNRLTQEQELCDDSIQRRLVVSNMGFQQIGRIEGNRMKLNKFENQRRQLNFSMNQFSKQSTVQTSKVQSISKKETFKEDKNDAFSDNFTPKSGMKSPISVKFKNNKNKIQIKSNEFNLKQNNEINTANKRPVTRDPNANPDLVFEGITLEQYFQHRKKGLANALKSQQANRLRNRFQFLTSQGMNSPLPADDLLSQRPMSQNDTTINNDLILANKLAVKTKKEDDFITNLQKKRLMSPPAMQYLKDSINYDMAKDMRRIFSDIRKNEKKHVLPRIAESLQNPLCEINTTLTESDYEDPHDTFIRKVKKQNKKPPVAKNEDDRNELSESNDSLDLENMAPNIQTQVQEPSMEQLQVVYRPSGEEVNKKIAKIETQLKGKLIDTCIVDTQISPSRRGKKSNDPIRRPIEEFKHGLNILVEDDRRVRLEEKELQKRFLQLMELSDNASRELKMLKKGVKLLEILKSYVIDYEQVRSSVPDTAFKKMKLQLGESICSLIQMITKKHKIKKINEDARSIFVKEFEMQIKDIGFQEKLSNAEPELREFLNELLKDFRDESILPRLLHCLELRNQEQTESQESLVLSCFEQFRFSEPTIKMLAILRIQIQKYVTMQLMLDQRNQIKNAQLMDFRTMFQLRRNSRRLSMVSHHQAMNMLNLPSQTTQKFRLIVKKHFLTKSLREVENMSLGYKLNIMHAWNLFQFKIAMHTLFPIDSQPNIGRKYFLVGKNQFRNDQLRDIAQRRPEIQEYFRCFVGELYDDIRYETIKIDRQMIEKLMNHRVDEMFKQQIERSLFYQVVKQQKLTSKDCAMVKNQALLNFYNDQTNQCQVNEPIDPSLIDVHQNVLLLVEKKIDLKQAIALRNYFKLRKFEQPQHIRKLIIDDCAVDDEQLMHILSICIEQTQMIVQKDLEDESIEVTRKKQILTHLSIQNTPIGKQSCQVIQQLNAGLLELKLNNLKTSKVSDVFLDLTRCLIPHFNFLIKLSLSNINMNCMEMVSNLANSLQNKSFLQRLELSWCNLLPKHLCIIVEEMKQRQIQIREIDFSYNQLFFQEEYKDLFQDSVNLISLLKDLFKITKLLNHVNFAGMNITGEHMLDLCQALCDCTFILGIHLCDNGLNFDRELMNEVLHIFALGPQDIPIKLNTSGETQNVEQNERGTIINKVKTQLRQYMDSCPPQEQAECMPDETDAKLISEMKIQEIMKNAYQKNLIISNELRRCNILKKIHQCHFLTGHGRLQESMSDPFVLTRFLNHAECIFNQDPQIDRNKNTRFFVADASSKWRVCQSRDCFICHRFQYTTVFYERGVLSKNQDLTEITDPGILSQLIYEYKKNQLLYGTQTPLICGTLVNRAPGQGIFDRKLKMLRTSCFCLLSVCQCVEFTESTEDLMRIKQGIQRYLKSDAWELLGKIDVQRTLIGWKHILFDMVFNNELTDIRTINLPDITAHNIDRQDWFTFSGFFPAGYHQILIFDPKLERAFVKDFVLVHNQREFMYPEYPVIKGSEVKIVQNMWRKWVDDTPENLLSAFSLEIESFDMNRFVKLKQDVQICKNIMKDQFDKIITLHKELQTQTSKFPVINSELAINLIDEMQKQPHYLKNFGLRLKKAQIEISYIGACKSVAGDGLRNYLFINLQRSQILEYVLRLAQQVVVANYSTKQPLSQHLEKFIRTIIEPIIERNRYNLIDLRKDIRNSHRLNELLFDNHKGLLQVFDHIREKYSDFGKFTLQTAIDYFDQYMQADTLLLTLPVIEQSFILSMMTVLNESKNMEKYQYLVFVEFQEMVCRLANYAFQDLETIDYKVYWFLKAIWENMYSQGIWSRAEMSLYEVQQNVQF